MASTAAGTSIGISLVPPLCTAGFGLADGDHAMAVGAGLLFTANITGIFVVASVAFPIVGFGQFGRQAGAGSDAAQDLASRLGRKASRRLGVFTRVVLPLVLLAAIYLPLDRALGDMTRRSAIRTVFGSVLAQSDRQIVQSAIAFDAAGVGVRVVIVGSEHDAQGLQAKLRVMLAAHGEDDARVRVGGVPEASAPASLASRSTRSRPSHRRWSRRPRRSPSAR
jgi:hypothetical protein